MRPRLASEYLDCENWDLDQEWGFGSRPRITPDRPLSLLLYSFSYPLSAQIFAGITSKINVQPIRPHLAIIEKS